MIRKYAYKVVRGELILNNNDDKQKVDELIKEWNNAVLQYTNMYAKLEKFIDIQTKLPKNLQRNVQNAIMNLKNIMEIFII
jgi:hypothetical protein